MQGDIFTQGQNSLHHHRKTDKAEKAESRSRCNLFSCCHWSYVISSDNRDKETLKWRSVRTGWLDSLRGGQVVVWGGAWPLGRKKKENSILLIISEVSLYFFLFPLLLFLLLQSLLVILWVSFKLFTGTQAQGLGGLLKGIYTTEENISPFLQSHIVSPFPNPKNGHGLMNFPLHNRMLVTANVNSRVQSPCHTWKAAFHSISHFWLFYSCWSSLRHGKGDRNVPFRELHPLVTYSKSL